jgi:hypothetical protein
LDYSFRICNILASESLYSFSPWGRKVQDEGGLNCVCSPSPIPLPTGAIPYPHLPSLEGRVMGSPVNSPPPSSSPLKGEENTEILCISIIPVLSSLPRLVGKG